MFWTRVYDVKKQHIFTFKKSKNDTLTNKLNRIIQSDHINCPHISVLTWIYCNLLRFSTCRMDETEGFWQFSDQTLDQWEAFLRLKPPINLHKVGIRIH